VRVEVAEQNGGQIGNRFDLYNRSFSRKL